MLPSALLLRSVHSEVRNHKAPPRRRTKSLGETRAATSEPDSVATIIVLSAFLLLQSGSWHRRHGYVETMNGDRQAGQEPLAPGGVGDRGSGLGGLCSRHLELGTGRVYHPVGGPVRS